jgi:cell division protein FtsQ
MALPLVKNANVRKFFPDRLVIEITERQPFGLWQKDGSVQIIAADGAPIDQLGDAKFERLPFVVGEGANLRIEEFVGLLDAAGDLRDKIRAGMLVSQRRWTLKMNSGVEVMLPEIDPKAAVRQLAQLEQDGHVVEKDVVSLDLRIPGKLYVRLTEEAVAAREAAAKARGRGAHT